MSATWVAIPRTTYERLLGLVKGAGHKYLKKVHAGVDPRTGKTRWRYYYKLTEGRALGDTADLAVGAKFQVRDGELKGHVEVLARHDDGTVTVRHDESGKEERLAADALRARLVHEHRSALEDHARRLRADYVRARLHGGGSLRERRHAELRAFVAKYPELRSWAEELPEPRPPAWRPAGYDENRRILDAFEGLRVATPRFDGHAAQGPRPIPAAYKRAAQTLLDALAARFGSLDDATTKGQKYLENASKGADVKGLVSQLRRLIAGSEAQWWDYAAGGVHQTEQAVVFHQAKLDLAIDAKEPLTAPAALFADIVRTEARRSYVVDNKGTRTGLETLLDMAGQVRTKRGLDAFVMLLRAGTGPGASNTRAAAETLGYTLSTAREAFQRAHEEMARLGRESLVSTITRPTPELDAAIAADIKTVREADLEDIGDMLESTEQSTMRHGLGRFEQVADVREHRFSQLTPEHSEVKRLFRERFGVRIALEDSIGSRKRSTTTATRCRRRATGLPRGCRHRHAGCPRRSTRSRRWSTIWQRWGFDCAP